MAEVVDGQPDRLLRRSEVADRLALSLSTVKKLEKSGVLPVVRVGPIPRMRESDVAAIVANGAGNGA